MKAKLLIIPMILFVFFIYLAFLGSLTWGAIIMKDDGTSMNYIVDGEQSIKVKTSSGESTIKLSNITWMAGTDKKRIRLIGKSELLIGEIQKTEIKVKEEDILIPLENIIFFLDKNIKLDEKSDSLSIVEHDDGNFSSILISRNIIDSSNKLRITFLPRNWEGNIKISKPIYTETISSMSDLNIDFDIQGDFLNKIGTKTSLRANILFNPSSPPSILTHSMPLRIYENDQPLISSQHNASICFSKSFYNDVAGEVWGKGDLYFYITSPQKDNDESLKLGRGQLKIYRTVSNVLELPISIVKNGPTVSLCDKLEEQKRELAKQRKELSEVMVHLRIIIVDSKSDAEAILLRLEKGDSFIKIAKEKSIGPNHDNDGDLGNLFLNDIREEMRLAIEGVNSGQFTKIFQLDSKFAILYLESISKPKTKINK